MAAPKLNVILHGAFVFVRDGDELHALIPNLDEHAYRAGSWLAETGLRGRTPGQQNEIEYELTGVNREPGNGWFDLNRNLFVREGDPLNAEHAPFATLRLPLPKTDNIKSLRLADVPRDAFTHPERLATDADPQRIATLQVLTYDIDDPNRLGLRGFEVHHETRRRTPTGGHYWEPVLTGNIVNLHIFSAEDHFHRLSNSDEDLNLCFRQLGTDIQLDTRFVPTGITYDDDGPLPDGVKPEETETLAVRTLRMARLGRLVLDMKGDANLAWYGNDALDGEGQACGSTGKGP
jgi:hypothetical protein